MAQAKIEEQRSALDSYLEATERITGSVTDEDRALLAQAVQNIADVANHLNVRMAGVYIAHALHSQHRYLQSEVIQALGYAMQHYGETPELLQDARNAYAVEVAAKMAEPF